MSFAVHFISAETAAAPHPLGDPVADLPDDEGDEDVEELTADEIAAWDGLHPRLVELLPAGAHDVSATPFARQLVHEATGLMVTWAHDDYEASVPFWSENATAELFDTLAAVTEAIEAATGRVGVDEISEASFLDHREQVQDTFAMMAAGFEQAMERQTVLGWLRSKFKR